MIYSSRFMRLTLFLCLIFVSACKETQADSDAGLYDPVPPAGAAFVRFVNVTDDALQPAFKKKKYANVPSMAISPYYVFKKGEAALSFGGDADISAELEEGGFYTIASDNLVIKDQPNTDRTKATIAFYNLSQQSDTSLKAKDGKITIFDKVSPSSMMARDMNAVKIDFSVYDGEKNLKQVEPKIIERGNHYSVIYTGDHIFFATAETNTRD